jgi:hypothetical protein
LTPLADAREKAASARRKIAQGLNPIDELKRDAGIPTLGEMADDVRDTLSAGFRNGKHKAQWKSTLETYAAPLRAKPVDTIATDDVLAVLKPIWIAMAEIASRYGVQLKRSWMRPGPRASRGREPRTLARTFGPSVAGTVEARAGPSCRDAILRM